MPRAEVRDTAPKIVSLEIPIDKIGEVIGPKGKVINALQQETGTDIAVDDDGVVGTVTIGARDGGAVAEARRRIEMILDPPKAEVGAVYTGKVVNITKFGAFVNILPGRDGLVHISKLGRGKRIDKVEDVVDLGDEIEVRVDDIDPQGKVSLSLAGNGDATDRARRERRRAPAPRRPRSRPGCRLAPTGGRVIRGHLGGRGSGRPSATSGPAPTGAGLAAAATTRIVDPGATPAARRDREPAGLGRPGAVRPGVTLQTTTLDEGLTVVTERMPDVRSVSIGFWVGTGSVDEAPAQSGASHFLEHLLFKGTADPQRPQHRRGRRRGRRRHERLHHQGVHDLLRAAPGRRPGPRRSTSSRTSCGRRPSVPTSSSRSGRSSSKRS